MFGSQVVDDAGRDSEALSGKAFQVSGAFTGGVVDERLPSLGVVDRYLAGGVQEGIERPGLDQPLTGVAVD